MRDTTGEEVVAWVPGWRGREASGVADLEEQETEDGESECRADSDAGDVRVSTLDDRLRRAVQRRQLGGADAAATAAPAGGNAALLAMSQEWEQWLKEASEDGSATASLGPQEVVARMLAQRSASLRTGSSGPGLSEYMNVMVRGEGGGAEEGRGEIPVVEGRRESSAREYARLIEERDRALRVYLLNRERLSERNQGA